jgi:hypothetical protein
MAELSERCKNVILDSDLDHIKSLIVDAAHNGYWEVLVNKYKYFRDPRTSEELKKLDFKVVGGQCADTTISWRKE